LDFGPLPGLAGWLARLPLRDLVLENRAGGSGLVGESSAHILNGIRDCNPFEGGDELSGSRDGGFDFGQ
jgi:hypothetical protein